MASSAGASYSWKQVHVDAMAMLALALGALPLVPLVALSPDLRLGAGSKRLIRG